MSRVQVVDGDGVFQEELVQGFVGAAGSGGPMDWGTEYSTVAIMGPQSSGKSTLLNTVFGTSFVEMDAMCGRSRTTQGVWMAKANHIANSVLVMDLEGSDGRERGEDDAQFERQAALFALAAADVLLINLWCHDIGREHGAGKPLLKTVLEVNLKLFQPRKTVLLFVIRDKSKTPLELLSNTLMEDVRAIWAAIPKPEDKQDSVLEDYYELRFQAMRSFEMLEDEFRADAEELRSRFTVGGDATSSLLGPTGTTSVPTAALKLHLQTLWTTVKENKDLNLPAHKVMVATVRCEEIANSLCQQFEKSATWQHILADSQGGIVLKLGAALNDAALDTLQEYDAQTRSFDPTVRRQKHEELRASILKCMLAAFKQQVHVLLESTLETFKANLVKEAESKAFHFANAAVLLTSEATEPFAASILACVPEVAGTDWEQDAEEARTALSEALAKHLEGVRSKHMDAVVVAQCKLMEQDLHISAHSILDTAHVGMWSELQMAVTEVTARHNVLLGESLEMFKPNDEDILMCEEKLEEKGKEVVNSKLMDATASVVVRMRERFQQKFHKDDKGVPRTWAPSLDIGKCAQVSKKAAAQLLALMAVSQLENSGQPVAAAGTSEALAGTSAMVEDLLCSFIEGCESTDPQASQKFGLPYWGGGVSTQRTLISPPKCRDLWRQFETEVDVYITQAVSHQEAARRANASGAPLWAIFAILVLGFDEALSLLYNPFYLVIIGLLLLVGKNVYDRLNVQEEMSMGLLPGLVALAPKVMPTLIDYLREVMEQGHQIAEDQVQKRNVAEAAACSPSGKSKPDSATHSEDVAKGHSPIAATEASPFSASSISENGLRQRGGTPSSPKSEST
mmetsp:Transcript_28564/g.54544  ORF Transcript_28564/g.54544 Transcript_28564/m.54544 type:complete len:853 (-) Transcript_28564:629-3187(-)